MPSCDLTNVPDSVRGLPLQRTFCPGGPSFALYGKDGASARILLSPKYTLDFKNYVWPPRNRPGEREFVYEELVWAREANGVLYVQNGHLTYARSSYGQNAYVTAFDAKTKRRLWRSKALVANAQTFAVTPDYLITGYGFTAEPDWLYLLDRRTGRVVERLACRARPRRSPAAADGFIVRTYDHVLTVELRAVLTCSASATAPRSRRPSGVHRRRRRRSATCRRRADPPPLLLLGLDEHVNGRDGAPA